ncbi:MAG: rod shape-determining protein MreC [Patescibacteria group bacterium]
MRKEHWFAAALAVIIGILVIIRPDAGWRIRQSLERKKASHSGFVESGIENSILKAEIAELKSIARELPQWAPEYLRASVYSRYPFNMKSELLVSVGEAQGAAAGQAAVLFMDGSEGGRGLGILLGRVKRAFPNLALVETVFDPGWKSAVRIGERGTEALLMGGNAPKLTLIDKKAEIKIGDIVRIASPDLPYGLAIAEVAEVGPSEDQLFQEAELVFAYHINSVNHLLILKNFLGYREPAQ